MSPDATDYWARALKAIQSAGQLVDTDPDGAASRAYYASFYAASALFALDGQFFTKHSAIKRAVHRDLVQSGRWPVELGEAYSVLMDLRATGDYGGEEHVAPDEARQAVAFARRILEAVHRERAELALPESP